MKSFLKINFFNFFVLFSLIAIFVYFYYKPKENPKEEFNLRNFEDFRQEFRKADGSFYSDSELVQVLLAKGIPFKTETNKVLKKEDNFAEIPIVFLSQNFSIPEQKEIQKSFSENYFGWYNKLPLQFSEGLKIEKVFVTPEKKIQLFFNQNFEKIAQEESLLTEFNEAFTSLGMFGLRGMEIFIEEKPLSLYLKELDKQRDEKASRENYRGPSVR